MNVPKTDLFSSHVFELGLPSKVCTIPVRTETELRIKEFIRFAAHRIFIMIIGFGWTVQVEVDVLIIE